MQVIAGVAGEAASSQLGSWFRRRRGTAAGNADPPSGGAGSPENHPQSC
jgi:hypothetical protein